MVRGKKVVKELLSPTEVESLTDEKRELESTIRELSDGAGQGTAGSQIDVGQLKRQVSSIDRAIGERTATVPRGVQKDALAKEERELEDLISEGMPTRYEMAQPSKNPGAVRKHIQWSQRNQSRIERYVQIQRTLRPMEPKSIEVLRKEK